MHLVFKFSRPIVELYGLLGRIIDLLDPFYESSNRIVCFFNLLDIDDFPLLLLYHFLKLLDPILV